MRQQDSWEGTWETACTAASNPRQDTWTNYEATIKNDPVFADVRDVIESAHKEIGSCSQRSYAAATGAAGLKIPLPETLDLAAVVEQARKATAKKLSELDVDRP